MDGLQVPVTYRSRKALGTVMPLKEERVPVAIRVIAILLDIHLNKKWIASH